MANVFTSDRAIVVGGGLAGVSAGNTLVEWGGKVILLDKSAFCGGNSSKATSGINGADTATQRQQGVKDSIEIFTKDCMKGGAKKPALVKVLAANSGPDVNWLVDAFDLDLSLLARLGGHSMPRTHRGKERFPGMTITYALIQMLERIELIGSGKAKIVTKAKVFELITANNAVIGCKYERAGATFSEFGPVILASGGFGADFGNDSLLSKHRPDLLHLPTSNGEHCTGDGIKMGVGVGADTIDLEWVQVHPTGLVKPDDPDAKVKFLAAEALRGVGGLVFDGDGERFANELGRRDYVTGEMWKRKAPIRLCLNEAAAKEIHWHCEHYKGRGVMKQMTGNELAKEIGCDIKKLQDHHDQHYEAAEKQKKDPEGVNGIYPAYPDGKSYDKPSGETGIGKKFFHNYIQGKDVPTQTFHVAIITPIIHYCMGGLLIDDRSRVLRPDESPIMGLYCAGEVMGGVHGNNRLGGNSLLDCVVYGRVAGREAAEYMLGDRILKQRLSLKDLVKDLPKEGEKTDAKGGAAAGGAAAGAVSNVKKFKLSELEHFKTEEKCWVAVNGQVLDVTSFLPDHPGGKLAILTFGGRDASHEFNMIHDKEVIGKYAPDAIIGILEGGELDNGGAADSGGLDAPLLVKGDKIPNEQYWGNWRDDIENNPSVVGVPFAAWFGAIYSMIYVFIREIIFTIFSAKNFQITNDRRGLTRSACMLVLFIVIHGLGNLHAFIGPAEFNGYGYFYVRLYWTGFGFNANIVEEYIALTAILHVIVALRRTWDFMNTKTIANGGYNLIFSGLVLLTFMSIHLQQFRFGDAADYYLRPQLMWPFVTDDPGTKPIPVRDIYRLEMQIFTNGYWCLFYIFSSCMFIWHGILGWEKMVPSQLFDLPQKYQRKTKIIGNILIVAVGLMYISFVVYAYVNVKLLGYDLAESREPAAQDGVDLHKILGHHHHEAVLEEPALANLEA